MSLEAQKPVKESGMLVVWRSNYHKLSLMSLRSGYLTKHCTDNRKRVRVFRTNHMINTTDGSNHKTSLIFISQSERLFTWTYLFKVLICRHTSWTESQEDKLYLKFILTRSTFTWTNLQFKTKGPWPSLKCTIMDTTTCSPGSNSPSEVQSGSHQLTKRRRLFSRNKV